MCAECGCVLWSKAKNKRFNEPKWPDGQRQTRLLRPKYIHRWIYNALPLLYICCVCNDSLCIFKCRTPSLMGGPVSITIQWFWKAFLILMLRSPFVFVSHVIIQSGFFPSFLLCNPPLPKPFFLFLLPCFLSSLSLVFSSFSSPFQRIPFASFSPFSIPFHLYLPYRFLMLDPRPPQSFSPFLRAELRFQKPTQNAAWVSGGFFCFCLSAVIQTSSASHQSAHLATVTKHTFDILCLYYYRVWSRIISQSAMT